MWPSWAPVPNLSLRFLWTDVKQHFNNNNINTCQSSGRAVLKSRPRPSWAPVPNKPTEPRTSTSTFSQLRLRGNTDFSDRRLFQICGRYITEWAELSQSWRHLSHATFIIYRDCILTRSSNHTSLFL